MPKQLKIAILIDQLVPGGVQKSAIQEALELKKLGHVVTLFVLVKLEYQYHYQDLTKGLKVVFLSDLNPLPFRKAFRIPYFSFLTHLHLLNPFFASRYRFLKNFDFIVSHGTTTCITAAAISKKFKIPYMAFIWDPMAYILDKVYGRTHLRFLFFILKPFIFRYERSFLTTAALIATPSRVHQAFLKSIYMVDPLIIYPGSYIDKFAPKKTAKYVLGYTRWELAKNPQIFIFLAKKLPTAQFLIAGSWTNIQEEYYFRNLVKKNGLEKRISLVSPITKKDLTKIASQSIAWVHPNFEAFGMAGLEMAANSLPIIVPKGSGVAEIFEEGIHGFFPDQNDRAQFLKNIKYLINNPTIARKMGTAAAKIAKGFTWKNHSKQIIENITSYLQKVKIVCIANAFVTTKSIGGGDLFLMEIARRVPETFHLTIILPHVGLHHWQKSRINSPNIRYQILPKNPFDNIDEPIPLFFTYIIRSIQTYFMLKNLTPFEKIHTATDIISDTIPAYFHKKSSGNLWIARFFHLIEPPQKRKGRLWVNIGSYFLQQISIRLLKSADIVMVDNTGLVKLFTKRGFESKKFEVHQGGVDLNSINLAKPRDEFRSSALIVGRLAEHKGIFDAIKIWGDVVRVKPDTRLIIIGYGPKNMISKLTGEIRHKKLEKNIYLGGYIEDFKTIIEYYKSSKIFLFLDHEAGFGLVVSEAMAAGLPVIAYNLPIFGSIYKSGYLTSELGNTQMVTQKVIDLLSNRQKLKDLSSKAKNEAKKFDWDLAAKKFYRSLIKESPVSSQPFKH